MHLDWTFTMQRLSFLFFTIQVFHYISSVYKTGFLTNIFFLTASRILNSMDLSVDPCDDFYTFSCGNWIEEHIISESQSSVSVFNDLRDSVSKTLKSKQILLCCMFFFYSDQGACCSFFLKMIAKEFNVLKRRLKIFLCGIDIKYRVFLFLRKALKSFSCLHFSPNFVDRYIDQQNRKKNEGMRTSWRRSAIKETRCIMINYLDIWGWSIL